MTSFQWVNYLYWGDKHYHSELQVWTASCMANYANYLTVATASSGQQLLQADWNTCSCCYDRGWRTPSPPQEANKAYKVNMVWQVKHRSWIYLVFAETNQPKNFWSSIRNRVTHTHTHTHTQYHLHASTVSPVSTASSSSWHQPSPQVTVFLSWTEFDHLNTHTTDHTHTHTHTHNRSTGACWCLPMITASASGSVWRDARCTLQWAQRADSKDFLTFIMMFTSITSARCTHQLADEFQELLV